MPKVAVTSPSFSKHPILRNEIQSLFPDVKLNNDGIRFKGKALLEYIQGYEAIVLGLEKIDKQVLEQCSELKIIAKYGVGLNNLDLDACKRHNVHIGWTGGVNRLSVAEMTLGYMLMIVRNLYMTSNQLKSGVWNKSGGYQITGKKIGIIGVGHIGKEVIRLLKPFKCEIWVNDIIDQEDYYNRVGVKEKTKEEIYAHCDIISLHTPHNDSTHHLISNKVIQGMKDGVVLINSARGGIICESDLKKALKSGKVHAAAIDAYEEEPPTDKELLEIPNLITTPHIGGNAKEAVLAMGQSAIKHLKNYYKL